MSNELRDLLKSQNLDEVLATSLKQVGGAVYPDKNAKRDLDDFVQVVQSYRGVHSPTFGVTIPMSGAVVSADGSETLLQTSKTQVAYIQGLMLTNAGGAPIEVLIKIGGVSIMTTAAGPGAITPVQFTTPLYIDYFLPLSVTVTNGTASDLTTTCAYTLVVQ